ncbi:MAG: ATP-dependent Clp protease ATP-binding subunit [Patescibacteria group bacterium]|nr:ATP-dependent Clp protease ATP-binding subunit [Patescibacteria group bacterium]MDD4304725.1 ATP-dependent Clp protease ATP-binding subunit [Patescibacteria group bacterium]MDD4695520.1 ATP-dependent Clp protease ATP-binding subunit [Patescibacteria group bacterium]
MEDITNIFGKFSKRLKTVLVKAQDLAGTLNKKEIDFWEVLYCLSNEKGSIAFNVLKDHKIISEDLKKEVLKRSDLSEKNVGSKNKINIPIFSQQCQDIIEQSVKIAYQNKHSYIGTEHLLAAIFKSNIKELDTFLSDKKINKNDIIKNIDNVLIGTNKFTDILEGNISDIEALEKMLMGQGMVSEQSNQQQFTIDLTSEEMQKKLDPVIGRKKEIDRLINILCRRTKNNPVLLGEPGVGKTAIVEGLAKKIFEGDVPQVLHNKRIITLDLGAVIAGTMYRGEFEKRLKKIIDDAKKDDDIILFIDEIHTLVGAGASGGQLDAANLLKPELAKGDLKVIGATTVTEYKKYIESDPAFERRFQAILVDEPLAKETEEILKGLRENYEKYHLVKISDDAIKSAVELSQRYMPDKFLPDKAIDIIDEAASKLKVRNSKNTSIKKISELKNSLHIASNKKEQYIDENDFEKAMLFKENEDKIILELKKMNDKISKPMKYLGEITEKDVAEIVSKISGVPIEDLLKSEKRKLVNLEQKIQNHIIGQNDIVKEVSNYIRRSKAGLSHPNKPIASFIFLGPSGVGKTELAKVLAKEIYNDEKSLVRIDMSEFSERFDASKLIGAPAGYVGYKDSNKFTDRIRLRPYSIVLFDEIEKAHPDIFNLLLTILEDGYITDASGRVINFKNTIIIMTSNIGNEQFNKYASIGFDVKNKDKKEIIEEEYVDLEEKTVNSLSDYFRPEFLNRIDKILVFKNLDIRTTIEIAKLKLSELVDRLNEKRIKVSVDNKVYKFIAENSFNSNVGARNISKFIQNNIESGIANDMLADKIRSGNNIKISIKNKKISIAKI